MKDLIPFLRNAKEKARLSPGYDDPVTGARNYTPWKWKVQTEFTDGVTDEVYVGWNGEVWMYHALELKPSDLASTNELFAQGAPLDRFFSELVERNPKIPLPVDRNREWHLVSTTSYKTVHPSEQVWETYPELAAYQIETFKDLIQPVRLVALGVRLLPSPTARSSGSGKWFDAFATLLSSDTPDMSMFAVDGREVGSILRRAGGRPLSREQQRLLESWYNNGQHPEQLMGEHASHIDVYHGVGITRRIQMSALADARSPILRAPFDRWINIIQQTDQDPIIVSIRGEVQSGKRARMRARSAQRHARTQAEEQASTGDLDREEIYQAGNLAALVEREMLDEDRPLLSSVSVVFGKVQYRNETITFADHLEKLGLEVAPLIGRQMAALDETLPCSSKRVNPYLQDFNSRMVAYAGVTAFPDVGDGDGIFLGLTAASRTPVFLDPYGASKANKPATMGVFGDSGAGKTWLLQSIASQATLMGVPVVFINPKGDDPLLGLADITGGVHINLSADINLRGALDPFATIPFGNGSGREKAINLAVEFLETTLQLTQNSRDELEAGIREAFIHNPNIRTLDEALDYIKDERLVNSIRRSALNPLKAIALRDRNMAETSSALTAFDKRLTLIEFGAGVRLPAQLKSNSEYSDSERTSVAVMRLLVQAAIQRLVAMGGGVLIVDEAWTFLSSPHGYAALEELSRLGRSYNILLILATQRISDITQANKDLSSYLSRVMVMQLQDPKEAEAALDIARIPRTEDLVRSMYDMGPRNGRPSVALLRDLRDHQAPILVGPAPERYMKAFSTNPEEKAAYLDQQRQYGNSTAS